MRARIGWTVRVLGGVSRWLSTRPSLSRSGGVRGGGERACVYVELALGPSYPMPVACRSCSLRRALQIVQVYCLVLQGAPQPFDEPDRAVHRQRIPAVSSNPVNATGELAALIGVEDLRNAVAPAPPPAPPGRTLRRRRSCATPPTDSAIVPEQCVRCRCDHRPSTAGAFDQRSETASSGSTEQSALPAHTQTLVLAFDHRQSLGPTQRPSPRDKKSRSTVNSPILACRS